jgi:hypothetical protein
MARQKEKPKREEFKNDKNSSTRAEQIGSRRIFDLTMLGFLVAEARCLRYLAALARHSAIPELLQLLNS